VEDTGRNLGENFKAKPHGTLRYELDPQILIISDADFWYVSEKHISDRF
jgi:hypothetical protein